MLLPLLTMLIGMPADDTLFFEKSIRPLLVKECQSCHSSTGKKRGGLVLDTRAGLLAGGDSGPAVVAGQPDKSLLVQAVEYSHDSVHMPPAGKLAAREVALLRAWVARGAFYPGPEKTPPARAGIDINAGRSFWSFQPLRSHTPPESASPWPRRRIDAFLLSSMSRQGLAPAPAVDRRMLLRRLAFDLTGLPPTPEDIEAFATDSRPDALERQVDRLLASPAHGERWGRFWLDLVRYADVVEPWTEVRGSSHHYRDWVVRATNADLGYDQFITRQLAADFLPDADPGDRAALGMLGLAPTYWKELKLDHNAIKGVVAEEWEEHLHTLGSAFLGLTVACARCHDHKFDPIRQTDYYALAGVLASVRQADIVVGLDRDRRPIFAPGVTEESLHVLPDGPHRTRLSFRREPQNLAVQVRGNPAVSGSLAPRQFLAVLSAGQPRPLNEGSGRLDLARALTGEAAPLLARVAVNRVWSHHFGSGLVRTPSDFGSQGDRPTHPELLDDLATRFVDSGWSLKFLHREIVLSAAYQQANHADPTRDPDNRWLARMSRRRLEIEAWRDAMLAVTGKLDTQLGGPAFSLDTGTPRRTLYAQVKRRELHDLLRLHDFPDPTTHSPGRLPTTTPLQQLFALNSPFFQQQARDLAQRLEREAPDSQARIQRAHALLFGRTPTPGEVQLARAFLAEGTWSEYAQVLLASNEFLFID